MRNLRPVGVRFVVAVSVVLSSVGLVPGSLVGAPDSLQAWAQPAPPAARPAAATDDLEARFITTRPPVGPTWVVSIAGESSQRILMARSLQGLVNRTAARLYLIDGGDSGAQAILDRYVARGLVTIAGTTTLDGALDLFATEASGYVVADLAEPWSVHAASVAASLGDGIVTTPDQVAALLGRGLAQIDDTRGRYPDAVTAYQSLVATFGAQMPSRSLAVVRPTDTLWDFVAQQGILPVFTRPNDPSWPGVRPLFDGVPDGLPVFGYLSDTGAEEAVAVATLAATNLVLVPTDTTRNLSFHVAVGADQPRVPLPTRDLSGVAPCTTDQLNVVVGLTDGDNMNVPLNHFMRADNWNSPTRGDLPLGWSIGPDLAVLAPAAWDSYALEATPNDELVAMIGWGYGAPALMANRVDFYTQSFALMTELGMSTFWSLGGGLDTALSGYWADVDTAAGTGVPTGLLVGYGNGTGSAYYSPAGRPAFTSRSVYGETPVQMAAHLTALLATPVAQRPLVSFLAASNWANPTDDLIDALVPFGAQGVRFLTPAQAVACMPPAPEGPPPPVASPQACLPAPPLVQFGLPLISDPAAAEISRIATPFALATAVVGPATAGPGDRIDYTATISVDVPTFAADTLDDRVRPIIAAGYGQALADTAWMDLAFSSLATVIPLPSGTAATGTPTVVSSGAPATARWVDGGLELSIASVHEDTRTPGTAFALTVHWSVLAADRPAAFAAELRAGGLTFDLDLTIGVSLDGTPLAGGVQAAWACAPGTEVLASTQVRAGTPVAVPLFTG